MDEQQWLASTDPKPMLKYLRGNVSKRKLRLFAAACCRRVWGMMVDAAAWNAVTVAEGLADGRVKRSEQRLAFMAANDRAQSLHGIHICGGVDVPGSNFAGMAAAAAVATGLTFEYTNGGEDERRRYQPWECVARAEGEVAREAAEKSFPLGNEDEQRPSDAWYEKRDDAGIEAWLAAHAAAREAQCRLLRDIVGNPFRAQAIESAWRTPTVQALAQAAYEERLLPSGYLDPERLAVLADALEECGCSDTALLAHLRGPGPHLLGCHTLDLVLGKS
jgi:hypothetical protein